MHGYTARLAKLLTMEMHCPADDNPFDIVVGNLASRRKHSERNKIDNSPIGLYKFARLAIKNLIDSVWVSRIPKVRKQSNLDYSFFELCIQF